MDRFLYRGNTGLLIGHCKNKVSNDLTYQPQSISSPISTIVDPVQNKDILRRLTDSYLIGGKYRRIYHYHIRKNGGTSLKNTILCLGGEKSSVVRERVMKSSPMRTISGNKIFVAWNIPLINQGEYFFAYSHHPMHFLDLPPGTFTVTCLRDPAKRVISLYKMLCDFQERDVPHPCMEKEGQWLGGGFSEFLWNLPVKQLLAQLYMFSKEFNINEAEENIRNLNHFFFLKDFDVGVKELSFKTGLPLNPIHIRKTPFKFEPTEKEKAQLREMLEPEYELFNRFRKTPYKVESTEREAKQLREILEPKHELFNRLSKAI